jgi:antitoxin ParD1/3/4
MSNRIVKLTPDLFEFVQTRVESGRYENASELMRAALRALHCQERTGEEEKLANDIAEGDVFRKLWDRSDHAFSSQSRR